MGSGDHLLYAFPGFGMYAHYYDLPLARLGSGLAELVVVDLPNHGSTPRPGAPRAHLARSSIDRLASATASTITAKGRPTVLLGESLGGALAVKVAGRLREAGTPTDGLILVSPPVAPRPSTIWRWTRDSMSHLATSLREGIDIDPIYDEMVTDPGVQRQLRADPRILHRASLSYLAQALRMSSWLAVRGLSDICEPTLMVMGEKDPLTSASRAERLAMRANARITVVTIPGASHGLLWDFETAEVVRAIREWLEGIIDVRL